MDPSKLLRASNDGKVEWNTTRCILPVDTVEYATVILASDWLYFSRHGINVDMYTHIHIYIHIQYQCVALRSANSR